MSTDHIPVACFDTRGTVLYFPVRIIWRIRTRPTQKIALTFSLCLTAVMIAMSAIRVDCLRGPHGPIDLPWSQYWMTVAALVGPVLGAFTAFRALFVAHASTGRHAAAAAAAAAARDVAAAGGAHGGIGGGGGGGGRGSWSARLLPASLWSDGVTGSTTCPAAARPSPPPPPPPPLSTKRHWFGSKRGSRWWLLGADVRVPRGTITGLGSFIRGTSSAAVCDAELLRQPTATWLNAAKDRVVAATGGGRVGVLGN